MSDSPREGGGTTTGAGTNGGATAQAPAKPRRIWLVAVVFVLAVIGALFAASRRSAMPTDAVALGNGHPKLFDFGMGICEQCKRMKPVMERAARELKGCVDVHVLDIRNEVNEQLAERYQMHAIPFILLVDKADKEIWRHEGFIDFPEISQVVSKHLGLAPGGSCGKRDR